MKKILIRVLLVIIAIALFAGAMTILNNGTMGVDPQTGVAPFGSGMIVMAVLFIIYAIEYAIWESLDEDPNDDLPHDINGDI